MTTRVQVSRSATLPDPIRVARCRRMPELGPRILFFSGGSALRGLSRALKYYTHSSIHLITPFDSGGSSATLRSAFRMLSVGDLRNRLMALADETLHGSPEIYALFSHRFPADADPIELGRRLEDMVSGRDALVADVPMPMRQLIQTHLRLFSEAMPPSFDLRMASIGNLILAGGYLNNDRDIDSVAYLFSKLVEVRGHVRPIVDADLHLAAVTQDGERIVGQHRLTGRGQGAVSSRIVDLHLVNGLDDPRRAEVPAPEQALRYLGAADVICYPMGSFFSSIVANLLPMGVGRAIRSTRCPKIYIPNTGHDPEQIGMTVYDAVSTLIEYVRRDAGDDTPPRHVVQYVLVDHAHELYEAPLDVERISALGVEVLDADLVTDDSRPKLDRDKLAEVLVSFA
jgi:CofD-related protein of GAK system